MAVLKSAPGQINPLYRDLLAGLHDSPRRIPSKYFYDDAGTKLFERITELDDYYPTRCEQEILRSQSRDILIAAGSPRRLNIIELGAGDGRKTRFLLEEARLNADQVVYRPVDISKQALDDLAEAFSATNPDIVVKPAIMDLDLEMAQLPIANDSCNLVLYLGSSIGNLLPTQQAQFLSSLRAHLKGGDFLVTGFDLKKDAAILRRAYDDRRGVTREFNMNLLRRLNRELGSDFRLERFTHQAAYNPATGGMESWLVSKEDQTVHVPELNFEMRLDAFEGLHVETSWKFSPREIRTLARASGFARVASFFDHHAWFVDELWEVPGSATNVRS
jgi:L-histidine N-alpha-methyltransferase